MMNICHGSAVRIRKKVDLSVRLLRLLLLAVPALLQAQAPERGARLAATNDVTWTAPGAGQADSMPIGNGDLAANVWTEENGDIVLLVAKADAWTETGKLVKLGRIRIHTEPRIFSAQQFVQTLHLASASIEITRGGNHARIWADANHPALHVEIHSAGSVQVRASLETWRTSHAIGEKSPDKAGMYELGSDAMPVQYAADRVQTGASWVRWFHFNAQSIYPTVLHQEHLDASIGKYPDPLLGRCFGAELVGTGMTKAGEQAIASITASNEARVDIVAASGVCQKPEEWQARIGANEIIANPKSLTTAWQEHLSWWQGFWNRSWIHLEGTDEASTVSQGYAMQRYMMGASSRGELPVKFNGGLFTVGGIAPVQKSASGSPPSAPEELNPDYRAWGNCFWNQNNRLLYWPLIETGDYDLLKPWFEMYLRALPLAKDRTSTYYHHDGAFFPETMYFFGLPSLHDFGWDNPTNEITSRWQRYHIQGSLEVVAQMLDYYDYSGDQDFARKQLVPFADAIVTYYGEHWPRGADGKIRMYPTQSLETYQLDITNPTPDIAGLRSVLPRMLALLAALANDAQRAAWKKTLNDLPELPTGKTTAKGKTPPSGQGDPNGASILLPAASYGKTSNAENPELYTVFPYHLFGVDKPGLDLARMTLAARRSPQNTCWGQDGTQAAALGLTPEAQKAAIAEFTNYGDQRFKWFWKPAHDWIPDLDNGGDGMITLEEMLLQADGRKILLLPAWPADWNAEFRLHAPFQTVVEGRVEKGKLVQVTVTPASRKADLILVGTSR